VSIFSKPEVVVLKDSNDTKEYLKKLQDLLPKASGDVKEKIEKEIAIVNAGIFGEDNIMFELKNSGMDLVVLHDIYLKTASGLTAQIDYLVIAPKYVYVVECKNLFGNIEINNTGDFIRTFQHGKRTYKEGIYSPITQNERHLKILKECRTENDNFLMRAFKNATFNDFFKGIVVLANPKTVINDRFAKKEIKEKVIRADQLINYIKETEKQSKELSSSVKEMREIGEKYLSMNQEERPDYIEKYEELVKELSAEQKEEVSEPQETSEELICPRCGSKLVLRTVKKGDNAGNQFYGCSSFPKCRYVKNI
jgi:hypothetical protein